MTTRVTASVPSTRTDPATVPDTVRVVGDDYVDPVDVATSQHNPLVDTV